MGILKGGYVFSPNLVASGDSLTVPENYDLLVGSQMTLDGDLILEGNLIMVGA